MKHNKLVELGRDWLLSAKQCNPVFTEKGSAKIREMPDVIGWSSQGSIIVECKTSLSDFRADAKKPFRIKAYSGMGKFRYYLFTHTLYALIPKAELPEKWGIVLVDDNDDEYSLTLKQARCKCSGVWLYDIQAELYYLRSRILEIQRFGKS